MMPVMTTTATMIGTGTSILASSTPIRIHGRGSGTRCKHWNMKMGWMVVVIVITIASTTSAAGLEDGRYDFGGLAPRCASSGGIGMMMLHVET